MTQVQFSANLLTQQFPYNFYELSNAVEVNRGLEKSGRQVNQPYFAENVLPITDGFSSIGFTEKVPENEDIDVVRTSFVLYGEGGRLALFVSDDSAAWVYDPRGSEWNSIDLPIANFEEVTHATIREETYIFLGTGIYRYDFNTQQLVNVQVNGIEITQVLGVASAGGRLILWDSNRVYYSSPLDPLEFTPGLDTGAGSSGVEDLQGEIVACVTLGKDFIIYSKISAVSARATDNTTFPFRYNRIVGSSGVNFLRHIAYNSTIGAHIVWTNSGFQQVTVEQAQYIWPELSDGIIRGLLIRRDELFGIPVVERAKQLDLKISFVSNRFIAVSVQKIDATDGEETYFDSYILDTALERWGKLAVPHSGFIEYVLPEVFNIYTYDDLESDYFTYDDLDGLDIAYRDIGNTNETRPTVQQGTNLGIILPNGSVQAISYTESSDFVGTDGADFGALTPSLFLGRYKVFREQGVQTQWLKLRKLFDAELHWYGHTYDGTFAITSPIVHQDPNHIGHWFGRVSADSVSLELRGSFKLTELILCLANAGQINQLKPSLETEIVQTSTLFEVPEFDYATSVLYPILEREFITVGTEVSGEFEVVPVVFRLGIDTESFSPSIAVTGSAELRPVTVFLDYPEVESFVPSVEVTGSAEIISVVLREDYPEVDQFDIGVSVSGSADLQFVVIRRDYDDDDEFFDVGVAVTGSATLETV